MMPDYREDDGGEGAKNPEKCVYVIQVTSLKKSMCGRAAAAAAASDEDSALCVDTAFNMVSSLSA